MIVPVGERYQQMLYLFEKKDGKLEKVALLPTLFVPMTGKAEDGRVAQARSAQSADQQRRIRRDLRYGRRADASTATKGPTRNRLSAKRNGRAID